MKKPQSLHRTAIATACSLAIASLCNTAAAQEREVVEEVLVTGTHIKGLDLKGAVQAVQLSRDDILESGAESIGELMQDLTVTGGGAGTFSTSTAGALSSDTPVGSSAVSLRGLGTGSTLTLINGRRATVSSFANGQASFIDINSIPPAAIERIEILPNGASATYGADAVAGVINYVLRSDFEGFEVSGSYGDSWADTDDGRSNLNLLAGAGNEVHHVMGVLDYYERSATFQRDRKVSRDSLRPSQQGIYPSFYDNFAMSFDQTEEPGDGGCAAEDFGFGNLGEFCEVNTNRFTSVLDEYDSLGGYASYQFTPSERFRWFNEVIYQKTDSNGTSSPANFSRTPIDPESPLWPAALQEDIVADAGLDSFEDFYGYPIYAWGKLPEPRAVNVQSETMRIVSGIDYTFNSGWQLESALTYGRNESEQKGISGLVISRAFYDANLGNLCSDGSRVERWDVNPARPDADFVGETCEDLGKSTLWYNPFGGQTSQAEGIDEAIRTTARREGESELYALDAVVSGDLFEFNGRTVKVAFGGEWRHEEVRDTPSGVAVASTFNPEPVLGFSSTSANAERDQWALFAEFYVPLADNLDLQLAGRYDDYDSFGGDFNPKVSLRYQPLDSLILRTNYSTSFRAPSLAQVGAGTLLSSYTVDCMATPEACDGISDTDGESLLSEDVSNDDLKPEEADTWGLGLVFSPSQDIDITLDYWSISYENVIGIDEDDFIRRALAGEFPVVGEGELPTGVPGVEAAGGFVTDAHFQLTNLGYEDVSGIDLAYTQYLDVGPGTLALLADVTYLMEYERQASDASPVIDEAGEYLYPELLANGKARYSWGDWRASLGFRYTSGYEDDPAIRTLEAIGLPADAKVDVDSWTVWDLNLGWDISEHSSLQLSARNVFDRDPPRVLGTSSNVDYINHDSMGRFLTLRYTYRL
ncbi:TonB-dependent receptor [Parahaliea aestuarii]|uniref:TonB-dependent receptor n=1 Tax=Parahaliea aestuarii TaxID=1852021 RepID=A0A5C8ZNH3_9GAMM|nr:TonB-dependent receptor [Parahaliea aestuarii]TXS90018.1 TonB-dependent receptor [Parahaliea aestuarii]